MTTRRDFLLQSAAPLLASLALPGRGWADEPADEFAQTLTALRKRTRLPAVAAVIVNRNEIVALGVAGRRRVDQAGAVTPAMYWQLGSITKTFTATLAAVLVERGKLGWDAKLSEIYPRLVSVMAPNVGQVTVRHLVEHRSGMGTDAFPWEGAKELNQPRLTLSQRRQRSVPLAVRDPLDFEPGSRSQYSNRGYNLLGAVLERVAGRSWEQMIVEEIARPLGINSVVFGEPALGDPNREPWPHVVEKNRWKVVPPVPQTMYGYFVCNPAGGISLTLEGVARWMRAHLNGEQGGEQSGERAASMLSTGMFKTIHTSREQGGVPAFGINSLSPALGRSLNHNGSNGRNYANLMILPERGVGVFFATNVVPPPNTPSQFLIWNTLVSRALEGHWPKPSLAPPEPNARGTIEGEALEVVKVTGGTLDFQNFKRISGQFQIWWSGAKDGDRLVLRFQVPRAGQYTVKTICARNADFGRVTFKIGNIARQLNFHADKLSWGQYQLGDCQLEAGPQDIVVTAHGSSGENGVVCHLGLDAISLREK